MEGVYQLKTRYRESDLEWISLSIKNSHWKVRDNGKNFLKHVHIIVISSYFSHYESPAIKSGIGISVHQKKGTSPNSKLNMIRDSVICAKSTLKTT